MKNLARYLKKFLFTVSFSVTFIVSCVLIIQPVFADPLPQSEVQALNAWTNWVANQCAPITSSGTNASPGTGKPDGAAFPNLDPTSMATSIDSFIQKENPNSEMKGLGSVIVASAKNSNVNPFLIVAIAHEESSLSDPSDYNVSHGNNSFGREATSSQPHFVGSHLWYKWSSVKASVDYNAPENQGAEGGGDMATYLRKQYGDSINKSNLVELFLEYAPPSENDTTQYINNVKGWISDMVNGTTGKATASPSSIGQQDNTSCACAKSTSNLTGSDNIQKIFNYFVGQGLSPEVAAGIDGNFGQESAWNPSDSGGYLAQWGGGRLTALENFAQQQGKPVTDLGVQLDYVWLELTGGPGSGEDDRSVLQHLKQTNSPEEAATVFSNEYERPGIPELQNRIMYANQIFSKYGSITSTGGAGSACGVDCTSAGSSTPGLSQIRQNVICITQQELSAWNNGKMKVGFRPNNDSSFSKYSQNSDEYWCADFVSWVYNEASYPLQPGSKWRVPAVQSVQSIGQQNDRFHWHPSNSYTPKPGDMAIHGDQHVNIVTAVDGNSVTLVGGDQNANSSGYPDGSRVSEYKINGFDGEGVTGYVSPD